MRNVSFVFQLLTALLCLCSGCFYTSNTWKRATSTRLEPEYMRAVAGCLVDRSVAPPRVRALVVAYVPVCPDRSYAVGSGETNYVVIDLDADGEPVWPFAYRGDKKEPDDVWMDLPEAHRDALSSVHFGQSEFEQGARAVHSREFVPANREGLGIHTSTYVDAMNKHPLAFYWPASETPAGSIFWTDGKSYVNGPPPTDAKRLVIPTGQPRPLFGIVTDMCFAMLMLPVEVGIDLIATPAFVGWAWGWWGS